MLSSKFVRYRSIIPVVDREPIESSYCWDAFLEKLLAKLDRSGDVNSRCPAYVIPVECFYQAPFAEYMKYIDTSVKVSFNFKLLDKFKLYSRWDISLCFHIWIVIVEIRVIVLQIEMLCWSELLLTFVVVRKHRCFLDIYYNLLKFKFEWDITLLI